MKLRDGRAWFQGPQPPWRAHCRWPQLPSQDLSWWELTNPVI